MIANSPIGRNRRATRHRRSRRIGWPTRLPLVLLLALGGCEAELPAPGGTSDAEPLPLERITRPADADALHIVRLAQRGDLYAFEPAELSIAAGDVVRFVMVGSQPESVAFDPATASPEAAEFIRSRALHLGVLLTEPGQAYDVSFRDAPAGRYPFHSLPHADLGMRGEVIVTPD